LGENSGKCAFAQRGAGSGDKGERGMNLDEFIRKYADLPIEKRKEKVFSWNEVWEIVKSRFLE
jgi:hypothetical protein